MPLVLRPEFKYPTFHMKLINWKFRMMESQKIKKIDKKALVIRVSFVTKFMLGSYLQKKTRIPN